LRFSSPNSIDEASGRLWNGQKRGPTNLPSLFAGAISSGSCRVTDVVIKNAAERRAGRKVRDDGVLDHVPEPAARSFHSPGAKDRESLNDVRFGEDFLKPFFVQFRPRRFPRLCAVVNWRNSPPPFGRDPSAASPQLMSRPSAADYPI
jgi:hypothetical protein